ncbi:STAS domain-containing protein [Pontibacter sp. JAM-7]|uniref:STAS domain-containing protein n=1 Tax=Pontibacter sp. JAM-7 TaxID=3366581 RepID=UPI003AF8C4C7
MAEVQLQEKNCLALQGPLRFSDIVPLQQQAERLLSGLQGEVRVDFSEVTTVDSSALSFWLCCQRKSRELGVAIQAVAVPDELLSIARLVGLDHELN